MLAGKSKPTWATWEIAALIFAISAFSEPVNQNFDVAQVNLLIVFVVMYDTVNRTKYAGFATGMAAGFKVTPALFIVLMLVTRRWADFGRALMGFAVTLIIGSFFGIDNVALLVVGSIQDRTGWRRRQALEHGNPRHHGPILSRNNGRHHCHHRRRRHRGGSVSDRRCVVDAQPPGVRNGRWPSGRCSRHPFRGHTTGYGWCPPSASALRSRSGRSRGVTRGSGGYSLSQRRSAGSQRCCSCDSSSSSSSTTNGFDCGSSARCMPSARSSC